MLNKLSSQSTKDNSLYKDGESTFWEELSNDGRPSTTLVFFSFFIYNVPILILSPIKYELLSPIRIDLKDFLLTIVD